MSGLLSHRTIDQKISCEVTRIPVPEIENSNGNSSERVEKSGRSDLNIDVLVKSKNSSLQDKSGFLEDPDIIGQSVRKNILSEIEELDIEQRKSHDRATTMLRKDDQRAQSTVNRLLVKDAS